MRLAPAPATADALALALALALGAPVALPGCVHSPPSPSAPALVGADVLYFDLVGVDRIDLLESCTASCPRDDADNAVTSITAWAVDWQWVRRPTEPCAIDAVDAHIDVTVALPRWDPPPEADPALVAEWSRYLVALTEHEEGHVKLVQHLADGSDETIQAAGCADAHAVTGAILGQIRQEERDYDTVTENGRKQGASFWGLEGRSGSL